MVTVQATWTVIDGHGGQPHDIVIAADPASTLGSVAAAIRTALRGPGSDSREGWARVVPLSRERTPPERDVPKAEEDLLWLGSRSLEPQLTLRESPLRDGCIVTLGAAGSGAAGSGDLAEPTGVIELRVAGGPAAGGVHRLGLGERTVGLAPLGGVAVGDPALADDHLRLIVGPASVHVVALPGRLVLREGQPLPEQGVRWEPGELLEAGNTILALAFPSRPEAYLRVCDDGGLAFDRPPRSAPDTYVARLEVPVNRAGGKRDKKAHSEYADALARFTSDLWMAAHHDALARRQECLDPAKVLLTALGPRRRLWERRLRDPDALRLRLGTSTLPARIDLAGPGAAQVQAPAAWAVPITVALREIGVLGVAGSAGQRLALARWLLIQAAVLHGPRELSMVVFAGAGWEWVRWLPHLRPRHGQDAAILVGNDAESAARRIAELGALIAARGDTARKSAGGSEADATPTLILLDGARQLREFEGMQAVLTRGPTVGVFAICIDEEEHLLPEECRAIVGFARGDPARLHVASTGAQERRDVLADQVSPAYARQVARALAPLREDDDEQRRGAPASLRLLDRLDFDPPDAELIADGWRTGGRSARALLGRGPDGDFAVDLHRDGPHLLVAGAPGTGKSELLLTMIAGLAAVNRPDAFTVLLIDDRANEAYDDCAELAHAAGRLTDLDPHTAARALASLTALVRHREQLVAGAGAGHVEGHLTGETTAGPALPRLMIVIDELTPLVRKLPDFVSALVELARRGQNLGIHLVVATAQPAVAISAQVAANSNIRIALRTADKSQSRDVIGAPDAGRIPASTPGHGYARIGTSTLVPFQSARIAGPTPGSDTSVVVAPLPWADAGRPPPPLPNSTADTEVSSDTQTDLAELVAAVNDAARQLQVPPAPAVCLPPLAEVVTIDSLAGSAGEQDPAGSGRVEPLPYALADLPARQRQETVCFDLQREGHLIVLGAEQSGRSTLLRTIAGSIAASTSPGDLHVHVIDCGSSLESLASLPHCGSMLTEKDTDALARLLGTLAGEVTRRQQLLARDGDADIAEQRSRVAVDARLPYLVVLLDGWEELPEQYADSDERGLIAIVHSLLSDGIPVGLHFVLSAGRGGLTGELSAAAAERILLRLDDAADYALAGTDRARLPAVVPPGRGLRSRDGAEIHVAVFAADPGGPAQSAAIQRLGQAANAAAQTMPTQQRPVRKEPLPARITAAEAMALETVTSGPSAALVGVGGETLGPRYLDLVADGPGLLVAGPARSGRTTTLATMLRSLLANGNQAVVLSPRLSPLRRFAGAAGVAAVFDGLAAAGDLEAVWAATESPKVLIVDDLELFGPGSGINDVLAALLLAADSSADGVVAAGTTKELLALQGGFGLAIRQSRSGVLLTPAAAAEGNLFELSFHPTRGPSPPGRGLLVRAGVAEAVQVATAG